MAPASFISLADILKLPVRGSLVQIRSPSYRNSMNDFSVLARSWEAFSTIRPLGVGRYRTKIFR